MTLRLKLLPAALIAALVVAGCGGGNESVEAASRAAAPKRSVARPERATTQPTASDQSPLSSREEMAEPSVAPARLPIRIICDHDGAHADSQIDPTAVEAPPEATFQVLLESDLEPFADLLDIHFSLCGGGDLGFQAVASPFGLRVIPSEPMVRGEVYSLSVGFPSAASGIERLSEIAGLSIEVCIRIPRIGALDVIEVDLTSDGVVDRILIASEKLEVMVSGHNRLGVSLPDVAVVRDAVVADFDLDGRQDIAVLGLDSAGRGVLHWLRNLSLEGMPSFQARRIRLPSDVKLPVSIHAVDLGRTGLTDLLLTDFAGGVYPLHNRLRGAPESIDPARPFEAGAHIEIPGAIGRVRRTETRDLNRDGFVDVLVSGTRATALLWGTPSGFLNGEFELETDGATTYMLSNEPQANLLVRGSRVVWIAESTPEGWTTRPLMDLPTVSTESMMVGTAGPKDEADLLLAYREGEHGLLRRFAHRGGQLVDRGGRVLEGIGRVNAIRPSDRGGLLVCAECGLYELAGDTKPRRVFSFDSRVLFDSPAKIAVLPPMASYVLADLDGDGRLDVAGIALEEDGARRLGVWINRIAHGGGLVRTYTHPDSVAAFRTVVSMDVNHDRLADVLLLPRETGAAGLLLISNGDGTLREGNSGFLAATPADAAGPPVVVDLNGDGFADLFWPTPTGSISFSDSRLPSEKGYMFSAEGAKLAPAVHPNTGEVFSMESVSAVADFGSGRNDVVTVGRTGEATEARRHVVVYRNDLRYGRVGVGFRPLFLENHFDEIRDVVTGEFEPGHSGVAALCRDGREWMVVVWPRLDAPPVMAVSNAGPDPSGLHAVDIDGDGDFDLALVPSSRSRSMALYVNDGSGHRYSPESVSSASLASARANGPVRIAQLQDLDGDGRPDFLAQASGGDVFHSRGR